MQALAHFRRTYCVFKNAFLKKLLIAAFANKRQRDFRPEVKLLG